MLRDALIDFLTYKAENILSSQCKLQACYSRVNPVAEVQIGIKPLNQRVRSTAHIYLLMDLLVMSNVALVVIAANYSQQSYPCKSLTLHSSKGTIDTQLTTSESLSTRT